MSNIKTIKNNLVADLRQFVHSRGFKEVTFGLSGGMDSALVLALACEALGAENVYTSMMRTKFTSMTSVSLADKIATNFGNPHDMINIQPLVDETIRALPFPLRNELTVQNLQARIRGNICMAYSNEFGRMVLACSNKSEIAMGYCTLYGDTCGAVMPLGDLYKTQVYEMAELYPLIPRGIIERPASAELAHDQKDTDSLPPYEVLDKILQGKDDQNPLAEAIKKRRAAMEFKRVQLPPVIKVRG